MTSDRCDGARRDGIVASGLALLITHGTDDMRPVVHAAQRGVRDEAGWTDWFAALAPRLGGAAAPRALAWKDPAWLARRHDLVSFLQAVYVEADTSTDKRTRSVLPGVTAALKALP